MKSRIVRLIFAGMLCLGPALARQESAGSPEDRQAPEKVDAPAGYVLGPDDVITINAIDADEIANKPIRIDMTGYIHLPMVGKLMAAGRTVDELEIALRGQLKQFIFEPQLAISIMEFRSQPVSVIGAVGSPGVIQLQGRKNLIEILSLAGGLKNDAGNTVRITRKLEWGPIPLPNARIDRSGGFSIADVKFKSIMQAANPEENIQIRPNDVISVPRADLVYVLGEVKKPGGFIVTDRDNLSVLQALALAEGLGKTSSAANSKILRAVPGSSRTEIPINVKKILNGKESDVALKPDDILFIPNSSAKTFVTKAIEGAIAAGTGVMIYGRNGW